MDGSNALMPFGDRFFAVGPTMPRDDRSVPFGQFAKRLPIQNPDRPAVHRQRLQLFGGDFLEQGQFLHLLQKIQINSFPLIQINDAPLYHVYS